MERNPIRCVFDTFCTRADLPKIQVFAVENLCTLSRASHRGTFSTSDLTVLCYSVLYEVEMATYCTELQGGEHN